MGIADEMADDGPVFVQTSQTAKEGMVAGEVEEAAAAAADVAMTGGVSPQLAITEVEEVEAAVVVEGEQKDVH